MDLSTLSNDELLALEKGDLGKLSDDSLLRLSGKAPPGIMEKAGLGSAAETINDATTGAGDAMTLGFKDELLAGMASPFRAGYNAVQGKGFDLGAAYDTELRNQRNIQKDAEARSPIATTVGQVLGSAATVPQAITGGAATTLGMAGRGAASGALGGGTYGFGSGEGGLEPRLKSAAEGATVGGVVGGAAGAVAGRAATRAARRAAPTSTAFYELGDEAYKRLDSLGPIDPAATSKLVNDMRAAAKAGRVGTKRNAAVFDTIDDIADEIKTDGLTPGGLEGWRKIINTELLSDPKTRNGGMIIRGVIDDFAQNEAGEARGFFRQAIQLNKIEDAVRAADDTASRGSRNYELHLKNQIGKLLKADKDAMLKGRPAQFDDEMRKQMEKITETGRMDGFMQWLGKMSPDSGLGAIGNNLLAIGTGGSSLALQVPIGAAAYAAKKTSEGATRANIDGLIRIITQQGQQDPQVTARARALLKALTRGTVAGTQ